MVLDHEPALRFVYQVFEADSQVSFCVFGVEDHICCTHHAQQLGPLHDTMLASSLALLKVHVDYSITESQALVQELSKLRIYTYTH